ncbi:MAG: biotin/lipoyl-containing protein [Planctomycetota bacterium]|jgi:biotin carboxyl carrier protein|nr:biotin/lipoyl-containing protein [Planctomycetota bacterium]MDP6763555.1 biotin/lipoyl-containing protein [Planctomycetota bacterium]MDP6991001.1 biotin/lipoyl-containing protein [Planctomycetota bacterium]
MKYFARIAGEEIEVELVERLGRLSVSVDGEPFPLEYEPVDALGQVGVLTDGLSFGASVEGGGERVAVTIAGHTYHVEIEDERERAAHAAERRAAGSGGTVSSVMPGVVVTVLVGEGQQVEEGEPLLILEAMKMQNEIVAPGPGVVTTVHVEQGRSVTNGDPLVTLREAEE